MNLSVIVPVYNEVENIPLLHPQIRQALDPLDLEYEVIYVDDGSQDHSWEAIQQLFSADPQHVSAIMLRRNFGQTAALAAGIDHARGEVIVLIDADLQNDPADIPMLVDHIRQGNDLVSGWRVNRNDALLLRRLPSQAANWIISRVTGVHLHDYGCTLKAYRQEILKEFHLYGEMHRFIPVYAHMVGAKILEVPVQHHQRKFGKTKYGINRTFKVLLDLITIKFLLSYNSKPIYLFGGAGTFLILCSFVVLSVLLLMKIFAGEYLIQSPLLLLSVMLFILGFQSILMGLIAEMLARTYHESQHKPTYSVRNVLKQD